MAVRDQLKMSISAYQELFENSVTFGNQKQIEAETGKDQIKGRQDELQSWADALNTRVSAHSNR